MSKLIIALTGAPVGVNVLNGGIILALMSVPIIVSIGEDALKAVPDSYREAALALGATRWQLVYRVLLPAARNGLLAAVLLGVGRAVGETMAVLMATGHAVHIPHSLLDSVRTLTANIAAELGRSARGIGPLPGAVPDRDPALPASPSPSTSPRTSWSAASGGSRRHGPQPGSPTGRFARTPHVARKELAQAVAKGVFGAMAAAMVVPLLLIVGYLVWRPGPRWASEFLLDVPRRGMSDGGIWPAFVGTLYLVGLSLRLARRSACWPPSTSTSTRGTTGSTASCNLAVINLAGVPEHRPRALRAGRLRLRGAASAIRSCPPR